MQRQENRRLEDKKEVEKQEEEEDEKDKRMRARFLIFRKAGGNREQEHKNGKRGGDIKGRQQEKKQGRR
jgi:hypothetical protein